MDVAPAQRACHRAHAAEIGVVPASLPGERHVHRVVKVVGPVPVEPEASNLARPHPPGIVAFDLGDDHGPAAGNRSLAVHGRTDLLGQVHRAQVHDPVGRVEPETVEVELVDPVHRVVHQIAADLVAVGPVEVEPLAPGGAVAVAEVGAELAEVVPLGAEVVVHHVEQDGQAGPVGRVHQTAQPLGAAVAAVGSVERDPVVAPVAAPGKFRHRHDLERGHAEVEQVGQPGDGGVEGPRRREGTHVELVEDEVGHREPLPSVIGPAKRARVHHPAYPVHTAGQLTAHGIGAIPRIVEPVPVLRAGSGVLQLDLSDAPLVPVHGDRLDPPGTAQAELQPARRRRPDAEAGAAVSERDGASVERKHVLWSQSGSWARTTAPSGGRSIRNDAG